MSNVYSQHNVYWQWCQMGTHSIMCTHTTLLWVHIILWVHILHKILCIMCTNSIMCTHRKVVWVHIMLWVHIWHHYQSHYRCKVVGSLGSEIAVEIDHSPKSFDTGTCCWLRHVYDYLHFCGLRGDAFSIDDVAKVVDLDCCEERLVDIDLHADLQ